MSTPGELINSGEESAEAQDLEAAENFAQEQGEGAASQDEDAADESGEDISEFLEHDENYGDEPLDSSEAEPETPAEVATADEVQVEDEGEERQAAVPTQEVETPTPSEEEVTREDLLKMLKASNEELAALRANAGAADRPTEQETGQGVQDPTELRSAAQKALQEQYALSSEDADTLLTQPEQILPRLLSEMHLGVLEQVGNMLRAAVPNMVTQTLDRSQQTVTWEQQFFGTWKALEPHKDEVMKVRRSMKAAYPDLDEARLDEAVGSFVSLQHGIVPNAGRQPVAARPAQRATRPHTPVGRGATQVSAPASKSGENFFESLAEQDLSDS